MAALMDVIEMGTEHDKRADVHRGFVEIYCIPRR